MPDLEAFFRPKAAFVALYPTFFAWSQQPTFCIPGYGAPSSHPRDTTIWCFTADSAPALSIANPDLIALLDLPMSMQVPLSRGRPRVAPSRPFWKLTPCHTWPPCKYDVYEVDDYVLERWQTVHQTIRNFRID